MGRRVIQAKSRHRVIRRRRITHRRLITRHRGQSGIRHRGHCSGAHGGVRGGIEKIATLDAKDAMATRRRLSIERADLASFTGPYRLLR
jgi:hypothetical protein